MMDNKRYYWLKLQNDFFSDLRIKNMRRLAGGDTFTIIYLKMQLLSLKTNGILTYKGLLGSFEEEIALELDEDVANVQITIGYLLSCGLMEANNPEYSMTYVQDNIGSECAAAERMRNMRKRNNVTPMLQTRYVEKEIEKDKEIEIEIEIDKEIEIEIEKSKEVNVSHREPAPIQEVVNLYNDICKSYPACTKLSDKRAKAIRARLKTYTLDDFKSVFEIAEASDFLKGKNNRNWSATFDWLINDSNIAKVLDGNYNNKAAKTNRVDEVDNWI